MTVPRHDERAGAQRALRCAACDAPLAHDQRYCVDCGERRGPLPRRLAATIAAILEQGRGAPALSGPALRPEPDAARTESSFPAWMPEPRAAAAAVLAMLSFGVLIGSLVVPGLASTLSAPLRIIVSLGSSAPSASDTGSGGGAPAGSAAARAPAGATSSGSAGAGSTPAAGAQQQPPPTNSGSGSGSGPGFAGLPPIKHVFLIVLSDQGYGQTFGSRNKYLAQTLPEQGGLVPNYYAVAPGELANGIALISGQGPTPQTAADCPKFASVVPASKAKLGQVLGTGCVYPSPTETLANQLSVPEHRGWKAYVEGIGTGPRGTRPTCRRPALGGGDGDLVPRPQDPYVTWRNPFVYFQSLTRGTACQKRDVALTRLAPDLKATSTTPALSYIVPSPCDDGSIQPCRHGARSGLGPAIKFLQSVVPEIQRSPAYKADGLIAITFDQAPQSGPHADSTSCCDAQTFPNLPTSTNTGPATGTPPSTSTPTTPTVTTTIPTTPTTTTTTPTTTSPTSSGPPAPTGGGQVGILLISQYVKPGSVDFVDSYNHFSLLATIEKLFGIRRLGYASDPLLPVFGAANFNNYFG